MKLYNTMNKKSRNFPKYEIPIEERKAKKAERLRLRNVREQIDLNNRSQYDEDDDYDYGDDKNLE